LWGEWEHLFQAFGQSIIAGSFCAITVICMEAGQNTATNAGLRRELKEKGKEEVPVILLVLVTKVEIKIAHRS
jgi:hypothetical protein